MTKLSQDKKGRRSSGRAHTSCSDSEILDDEWELVAYSVPCSSLPTAKQLGVNDKNNANAKSKSSKEDNKKKAVTPCQLNQYRHAFSKDGTRNAIAQNALSNNDAEDVSLRRDLIQQGGSTNPVFSINLDPHGGMPATDQKDSGRCWMFATFNLFRFAIRKELHNADDGEFEFSESYLYFFHILEQANSIMELAIDTASRPLDDRMIAQFLQDDDGPIGDGGDWCICINLMLKYGLVPKSVYPESYTSSNTDQMMAFINSLLRSAMLQIRSLVVPENSTNDSDNNITPAVRQLKQDILADIYRILCLHLGTPPTSVKGWQWRDADGAFHRLPPTVQTPVDFMQEFVQKHVQYDACVMLIQDPRHDYYKRYTVPYSAVVLGGGGTGNAVFLNIPAEEMKAMSIQMLKDKLPVWFACNVDVQVNHEHGLWDAHLYALEELYGIIPRNKYKMTKADRLKTGMDMGTHVMLFTGVDTVNDDNDDDDDNDAKQSTGTSTTVRKWRVENSWGSGPDTGVDGYYTMNDNWFDEQVFEIVAPPKYLSEQAAAALDTEPIVLPAWDPMFYRCHRHSTTRGRRRQSCR